jgi:hypothetical protein
VFCLHSDGVKDEEKKRTKKVRAKKREGNGPLERSGLPEGERGSIPARWCGQIEKKGLKGIL